MELSCVHLPQLHENETMCPVLYRYAVFSLGLQSAYAHHPLYSPVLQIGRCDMPAILPSVVTWKASVSRRVELKVSHRISGSPNTTNNSPKLSVASVEAISSALNKWTCVRCTYLNWPNSTRCAMCGRGPDNHSPAEVVRKVNESPPSWSNG
jgi:hypothetical protein